MLTLPPLTVRLDLPAPCRVNFDPAASVMPRPFVSHPLVWARRLLLRRCPVVWGILAHRVTPNLWSRCCSSTAPRPVSQSVRPQPARARAFVVYAPFPPFPPRSAVVTRCYTDLCVAALLICVQTKIQGWPSSVQATVHDITLCCNPAMPVSTWAWPDRVRVNPIGRHIQYDGGDLIESVGS